jgi:hypothetical protein
MARRTYVRDRRGRFATVGATARGGRLTNASGKRYATETKAIAGGRPAGTIDKKPRATVQPLDASNSISRLSRGSTGAPRALRANAIRAFDPKSPGLKQDQIIRQIKGVVRSTTPGLKEKLQNANSDLERLKRRNARRKANDIATRGSKDIGIRTMSEIGRKTSSNRPGVRVIQDRAKRAAAAAAGGSKPAARAVKIYDEQLAYTGKGRAKAAKSNLRPGPSNTKGAPPKKRKRR